MVSENLTKIRKKIDKLDNTIHEAIMDRAALVDALLKEKKAKDLPIIMPDREAMLLRKIISRHKGKFPAASLMRIWREMIGTLSSMQAPLNICVYASEEGGNSSTQTCNIWDIARDYFGSAAKYKRTPSVLSALAAIRNKECTFSVLPHPQNIAFDEAGENSSEKPWWAVLSDQPDAMNITMALPFGAENEGGYAQLAHKAVAVSRLEFLPSGDDNSFLFLELPERISRTAILKVFDTYESFKSPLSLCTYERLSNGNHIHLVEVQGYIGASDPILEKIRQDFVAELGNTQSGESRVVCKSLGGYPNPLTFVEKKAEG